MIKSFADKETEKLFSREYSKKISDKIRKTAIRKLLLIDAAEVVGDLKIPPGNRLEKLSGDLDGYYSIRINEQFRVIFQFIRGNAYEVEIRDYH